MGTYASPVNGLLGSNSRPVTAQSLLVPQRLDECLPQHQPAVLDRMMGIDLQNRPGKSRPGPWSNVGEQRQHVVEERDAGPDFRLTGAVKVQGQHNARFTGEAPIFARRDIISPIKLRFCGETKRKSRRNKNFTPWKPPRAASRFDAGQIAFRVDGRRAPQSGGGHRLPVNMVRTIPRHNTPGIFVCVPCLGLM